MTNKELEAAIVDKVKNLLDDRNYWFAEELIRSLQALKDYENIE